MNFGVDEILLEAVLHGTSRGLEMTGVAPTPVGASRLASKAHHEFSIIVGLVGQNNGSVIFNLGQRAMLFLASKLLGEEQTAGSDVALDAAMEIGNIITGSIKDRLKGSTYQLDGMSVPSLIVGPSYDVFYARGISTASVDFEISELPFHHSHDRIFSVTVSLLRPLA